MTFTQALKKLKQSHWRGLERLIRKSYEEGFEAGRTRARGHGRRGRTIREDATVAGLVQSIEDHFGLDRYGFEVRVVHARSGRRVPSGDLLRKYRVED